MVCSCFLLQWNIKTNNCRNWSTRKEQRQEEDSVWNRSVLNIIEKFDAFCFDDHFIFHDLFYTFATKQLFSIGG